MVDKGLLLCVTGLFAFIGAFFSLYTSIWCEFVDVELPDGGTGSFGPWRYKSFFLLVDNGGGVWKVDTCSPISDSWDLDSKWKLARASTIIAPVMAALGGIACYFSAEAAAVGLLVATVFQGLTLLFLDSKACDRDQNPYLDTLPELPDRSEFGDCEMGLSAIMSIVAMCFFFVAALVACVGGRLLTDDSGPAEVTKAELDEEN